MARQNDLARHAQDVRRYLQDHGTRMSELLRYFPRRACGHSTELLSQWLAENGVDPVKCVYATEKLDEDNQSHAWVEAEGVVVDITYDQFGSSLPAVYVGHESELHQSFQGRRYDAPGVSDELWHVYERMRDHLRNAA